MKYEFHFEIKKGFYFCSFNRVLPKHMNIVFSTKQFQKIKVANHQSLMYIF